MPRAVLAAPLAVYGTLPSIEHVALSPSGSRLALVRTKGDTRVILFYSLADNKIIGGLNVGTQKLRNISWADDDHLMIETSTATVPTGMWGPTEEFFMLQVYDLKKKTTLSLPEPPSSDNVITMNVLTGQVSVRRIGGHTVLFIPGAYLSGRVERALFRYDLDSDRQTMVWGGGRDTSQWIVDAAGNLAAESDYAESDQQWTIKVRRGDRLVPMASGHAAIDVPELLGFGPTPGTLLMAEFDHGDPVWRLMSMADGSLGPPMAEHTVLQDPIEDPFTGRLIGGVAIKDAPLYLFFDPVLEARWESIIDAFAGEHVDFISGSHDFNEVVVRVEGAKDGYRYELVNLEKHSAMPLGDVYSGMVHPLEKKRITYAAQDGLKIPAYLTLPLSPAAHSLPLIVLPHGGPAARDTIEFDWLSQALAAQGYAVLQPNYRGSTLGWKFLSAGFGQWGRKMQTDLSDGVAYLVKQGIADPKRVCIVGASYGGYAALAGVTLQSGIYRCAVSIAGVSDLARMLRYEHMQEGGGNQRVVRYWDRFWGTKGADDPKLAALSPIDHIAAVDVPVLLIHGTEDTVVPFDQSKRMDKALRRAGKNVQFVVLKGEDHWLSHSATRLQMLQATVAFLRANDPPN